jgi:hypothetical protein
MDMSIDGKDIKVEAIHHDAEGRFRPNAGKTSQVAIGVLGRQPLESLSWIRTEVCD